jgi:hypothetical protein
MAGEKITKKEREAAISLLITVFEVHEDESLLNKALDDFLCCYGYEIPEWMQCLYNHFNNCDSSKTQVIKQFAQKHNLEISDGFK